VKKVINVLLLNLQI